MDGRYNKKLTNQIVDERLIGRNIKRLGDYIDSTTKIEFKCLKDGCGKIWLCEPHGIFRNQGCPRCSGKEQITNEIIDDRIKHKNLKRIDDCINSFTKIRWQCLKSECNNIWYSTPNSIFNNRGCPKCAGHVKITIDVINDRLIGKNIKLISEYKNINTEIMWKCLKDDCGNEWLAQPKTVFNKKYKGCPKCYAKSKIKPLKILKTKSHEKWDNLKIDNFLLNKNIIRLDEYFNSRSNKMHWKCNNEECRHTWTASFSSIKNLNYKCPHCSLKNKIEEFDKKLFTKNIKRLSNIDTFNRKIRCKCECLKENCGHIWTTSYESLINLNSGCPKCYIQKRMITTDIVDKRLEERNMIRLSDYNSYKEKFEVKCLKENCGHIWKTNLSNINFNIGCPKCACNIQLTNEIYDERIKIEI